MQENLILASVFYTVSKSNQVFSEISNISKYVLFSMKYFCVVKPEKYLVVFKKQRTLMYIAVVWCGALVGSVPPFFFKTGRFEFQPGKVECLYTFQSNIPYTVVLECVLIATPLTIITICYAKVFCTVSHQVKFSRTKIISNS